MDRHFCACANWNFQMGVYQLSQPRALLPEMWNLLRYNDVASSITHSRSDCFPIFAWLIVLQQLFSSIVREGLPVQAAGAALPPGYTSFF
jgi:hypothetical protein